MRWPFGPPHLTLKPSKKNPKKTRNKKQKKTNKQKNKQTKKERKSKNPKIPKKELFSYQSKFSFFLGGGVQKLPFLTTWPRKRAPPKHFQNRGFSLFFLKNVMRHETAIFGPKNPSPEIPVIIFFCLFSLSTTKNTQTS